MTPALSQATHAHYSPNPLSNVSSTHPTDGDAPVYAQVQPKKAQELILQDCGITRFKNPAAAVVVQKLLPLPERYGLPDIGEFKQLGMTQASRANATVLPSDGMSGESLVMAAPGEDSNAVGADERLARFGAALLSKKVAHVVCANHSATSAAARMPFLRQIQLPAQLGPLEMTFSQAHTDGPAPEQFRIDAHLPGNEYEDSGDIGVWNLNFEGATAQDVLTTLGALYQQSEGQNVAFCCQSGNSRSGAAALLFHQRKAAEEAFKRGEVPRAADLINGAATWEKDCKAARGSNFGTRMPEGLLESHAHALAAEIGDRLGVQKSKPRPAIAPKPVQAAVPAAGQQPAQAAALASKSTATAALGKPPTTPPQTPPKPARLPGPVPAPRTLKSSDTESIASGHSDTESEFSSTSSTARETFHKLGERRKPRTEGTPSTVYNPKPGEGKPLGIIPPTATEGAPSALQTAGASGGDYSEVNIRESAEYAQPWDLRKRVEVGAQELQAPPRAKFDARASIRTLNRLLQRTSENIYSDVRPFNDYSLPLEIERGEPTVHQTLHAWQESRHPQSAELKKYVHALALMFSQDAKQGLRFFAPKNAYGVGKAIDLVESEAKNKLWKELSGALATTMSEADPSQETMAHALLIAIMRTELTQEFKQLDRTAQQTWIRRSAKSEISDAIQNLQSKCDILGTELRKNKTPSSHEIELVAAYNLTLMSFMALHDVGTDPTIRI